MIIVDGKKLSSEILANIREDISTLKIKPKLFAILVGSNPASVSYLGEKRKKCEEAGIEFTLYNFTEAITTTQLRSRIAKIRKEKKPTAIIVQLPLPPQINTQYILDAIPPEEDVDVLSSRAQGLLATGKSKVLPPTAAAVLHIIETCNLQLEILHVVLVGIGTLVGKPLLTLFADKAASITVVRSKTENMPYFTQKADVLITGVGKPNLITGNMVKEGVVALDAGYAKIDGKVAGDLDFNSVAKKASIITPVPGGVGPLTVAMLIKNVVTLAKIKQITNNK